MDTLKASKVLKAFCVNFLDKLFLDEELIVLEIPKLSDYHMDSLCIDDTEINSSKRKLHSAESARQYAEMLAVAAVITETVLSNKFMSQRDVYYSLKHQFSSQTICNTRIIELGQLWSLKRYEMHITPTSRGYIAGLLSFRFNTHVNIGANIDDGLGSQWTNCARLTTQGGVHISNLWASSSPNDMEVELLESERNVDYLLVVEKEGVYKRLCEDSFHLRMGCIIVTGCGYPDISTRACVSRLASMFPLLVVVGVCDYNPHGLGLLHTYRCGSTAMAFEGAEFHTRTLKWIGLRYTHIAALSVPEGATAMCPNGHSSGTNSSLPHESFEKYTKNDHIKVASLLKLFTRQSAGADTTSSQQFQRYVDELLQMQASGRKCELESLYTFGLGFISAFLEKCILTEDYF